MIYLKAFFALMGSPFQAGFTALMLGYTPAWQQTFFLSCCLLPAQNKTRLHQRYNLKVYNMPQRDGAVRDL